MIVAVPKEIAAGERRVALVPDAVKQLKGKGVDVVVERGAGAAAGFDDAAYERAGATLEADPKALLARADFVLKVQAPTERPDGSHEIDAMRPGCMLVGFLRPLDAPELARRLAAANVTSFAVELVPRITRAQTMDALSSMSSLAGYRAVLLAAERLPRIFPMLVTAAGTIAAARVLVIGAGVAGLQAIGTARKLGAVVEGYDVRAAVKEQVESLGAKFVEMELDAGEAEDKGGYAKELGEDFYRKQRELMARVVEHSDVVITTAAIPGKKSPVLITKEMVAAMAPGSVIVDLAAERGGNCELTEADREVDAGGVKILGPTNPPATVPYHASQMYSNNIVNFVKNMMKDGKFTIDTEDEIVRDTLVTRGREVVNPRIRELLGLETAKAEGGAA